MSKLQVRGNCTGCGGCIASCPAGALSLETERPGGLGRKRVRIDRQKCTDCGACIPACPRDSLFLR